MNWNRWYMRWIILILGTSMLWYGIADGEKGLIAFAGLGFIAASCYLGTSYAVSLAAVVLGMIRNFIWVLPVMRAILHRSWYQTLTVQFGIVILEGIPVLAAFWAGSYLLRKKAPSWLVLLIPAGFMTGLGVWVPRQYNFCLGAMFADTLRGAIWLAGAELTGGLLLGWTMVVVQTIFDPKARLRATLCTMSAVILFFGLGELLLRADSSRSLSLPKNDHKVIALQGAVPPFAAGYAPMYERALYPMILLSSGLKPDLVILPENTVQVSSTVNPNTTTGVLQRHFTAVGMGVAVPSSQVAFGVRDFETSRIYWTDVVKGKPDVMWKDLQHRIIGVDYLPSWLPDWFHRFGWSPTMKSILPPQQVPFMNLQARDAAAPSGLKCIGKAITLMSGEVRSPRLIEKIKDDRSVVVGYNPSLSGWFGASEAKTSSIQARARFLELGLVAYRVGQLSGTEFYVPWRDVRDEVTSIGKGSLRFTARLPEYRMFTGYTAIFWYVSFYILPVFSLLAFGWWHGRRKGWIPA